MDYKKLKIRSSYMTDEENSIKNKFYIPVLKNTVHYKRAVGYFSSGFFSGLYQSISDLIKNGGTMSLIVSPDLSDVDKGAIKNGYDLKEKVTKKILSELVTELESQDMSNYYLLERLISCNILNIKIAFMKNYGIYHEKIGIMQSGNDEKIAFTGSLNETYSAIHDNFESIDVYRSWLPAEFERIIDKEKQFDELWDHDSSLVKIIDFPKAIFSKAIERYEMKKSGNVSEDNSISEIEKVGPLKPSWFEIREYQEEAIANWTKNEYRGFLAMATGTGKTLTAISCILELWNKRFESLFVIIVCPYKHLVEQWLEDLHQFNIYPIIAYSDYKWGEKLKKDILYMNADLKMFSSVIVTNDTFISDNFQKTVNTIKSKRMIIVDEAHNFGASRIRQFHDYDIEYRLGLSATPKRYFDEEGSTKLLEYFNGIVYELSLNEAIERKFLTQYYYYPEKVILTDEEYDDYEAITKKISRAQFMSDSEESEALSNLYIMRSRILNLASNKLSVFESVISGYSRTNSNLIYCAQGKQNNGERQIDLVTRILGNKLGFDTQKFTADEDMSSRRNIINDFKKGRTQCIVAIKCLDEGVNIPSIQRAFILASSGNEKEFIQRRGRVLRQYKNKKFAIIHDFIVLPRNLDEITDIEDHLLKIDGKIVTKELRRMKEFVESSLNKHDGEKFVSAIEHAYNIIG